MTAILAEKKVTTEEVIKKEVVPNDPAHFSDVCYRIHKSDQTNYLWNFPLISCDFSPKIELRKAGEMGFGVFAKADIEKNEYLCCYFGELFHVPEEYSDYTFDLVMPNNAYSFTVDSKKYGNISRYINHSYSPNCKICTEFHFDKWQQDSKTPYSPNQDWQYIASKEDANRYYYYRDGKESVWDKPSSNLARWPIQGKEEPHICFRADKKILKDEQLFINYGKAYWATREKKPI